LARKLSEAKLENAKHEEAFQTYSANIKAEYPHLLEKWQQMVHNWERDQSQPNPYIVVSEGRVVLITITTSTGSDDVPSVVTQAKVKLDLLKMEKAWPTSPHSTPHASVTSVTTLLSTILQLEDQQYIFLPLLPCRIVVITFADMPLLPSARRSLAILRTYLLEQLKRSNLSFKSKSRIFDSHKVASSPKLPPTRWARLSNSRKHTHFTPLITLS